MKRLKDDEKIAGPMFPRLHVNDTEKGGPRAPPRNKMALYEQLSIPSQRFNSAPKPSSSQVGGHEMSTYFPLQLPPSVHSVEKMSSRLSDVNNELVQQEQKKKQEEDDFRVPIFVHSGISQDRRGNHHSRDKEGHAPNLTLAPVSSVHTSRLLKHHNASERDPKRTDATNLNLRQEDVSQHENFSQDFGAGLEHSVKSASNKTLRQDIRDSLKQTNTSSSFGQRNYASKGYSHLQSHGNMQLDHEIESQRDSTVWGDSVSSEAIRVIEAQREMLRSPNDPTSCDAVSETSMVDSVSGIDISPDDVVGIIGQKHFWKARRAIVNQQRVFAVQVFELHRLIKVQKLIAKSPQLLVEESVYLKPLKVTPAKKLPLEYIVKSTPNISKRKDDCEKSNQNMEFSSENAVEKPSLSSVQNGSQPSHCKPIPGNTPPTDEPKMGPWSFNQQPGHHWLIPVMTPSEGLVYKPYPGPGFMSPVCGGRGPPGSTPMMGHNFVNYGIPPSHHHYQGLGVPPFTPPPTHGYFPPYSMPQMNPTIPSPAGEHMHHFNMQYQSTSIMPNEKNGAAVPKVGKFHASKESEVQVSTASSPIEGTPGKNVLPLFPTSPIIQFPDRVPDQPRDAELPSRVIRAVPHNARSAAELVAPDNGEPPSRVIRVVPHNARLATESVARIFQSIQEERKQYDSG